MFLELFVKKQHITVNYLIVLKRYVIGERSLQIQTKSKSLVANHLLLIREAVQVGKAVPLYMYNPPYISFYSFFSFCLRTLQLNLRDFFKN